MSKLIELSKQYVHSNIRS